jgi:hypothetical protein
MRRLDSRLRRLEQEVVPPILPTWPDWPLEDQFEAVLRALRVHRVGGTVQLATDHEIHLMGLLCALWKLPEGDGKHRFPSGAVVSWSDNGDGTKTVEASGYVRVEDLPEGVREYWARLDPKEQPGRDERLYREWPAAKERREYWRHYYSDEQVRARSEEVRRRDRELLERNRASVGLAPLSPEQLVECGLEGTRWGEGA